MDPRRLSAGAGEWGGFGHRERNFATHLINLGEQSVHRDRENQPRQSLRPNSEPPRHDSSVFAHMVKSDAEIRHREAMQQHHGSQNRPLPSQPFPSQPFPPQYGGFHPAPPVPHHHQVVYDQYGFPIPLRNLPPMQNPQMMPPQYDYRGSHAMPPMGGFGPGMSMRNPSQNAPPSQQLPSRSSNSQQPVRPFRELVRDAPNSGLLTFSPDIDPISGRPHQYERRSQRNERPRSEVRELSDGGGRTVFTGGFDMGSSSNYMFKITEGQMRVQQDKELRQKMADDLLRQNMAAPRRGNSRGRGERSGSDRRRMDRRMEGRGGGHRNYGNRGGQWNQNNNRAPQGPPIKTNDIDVMWNDMNGTSDPVEEVGSAVHSLVLKPDIDFTKKKSSEEPEKKQPVSTEEPPVPHRKPPKLEEVPASASTCFGHVSTVSDIVRLLTVVMNGNELFDDIVDTQVLVKANSFLRYEAGKGVHLDEETLSLLINDSLHPPEALDRHHMQLPRPVLLDGCAVAYSYDPKTFLPKWDGKTHGAPYHKGRVLPMKPLFLAAIHFISNGFKTSILLPEYYEEPAKQARRCKVDNLEAFNVLKELGLIVFVEPQAGSNLYDTIKEKVREVHGVFFSHPDVRFKYKLGVTEEGADEGLLMTGNKDQLKIEKAECNSDERMMTVMFGGVLKQLHVSRHFSTYTGLSTGLEKAKGEYTTVKETTVMFYTEKDGDEYNYGRKMDQQLKFADQVRLLLRLCLCFPLPKKKVRSIQMLLVLAFKSGIHIDEIYKFVREHTDGEITPTLSRNPSPFENKPSTADNDEKLIDLDVPCLPVPAESSEAFRSPSGCLLSDLDIAPPRSDSDADLTISAEESSQNE